MKTNLDKRVEKAVIYGVGGAIGSKVLMAAANVILSRGLGQEVYGKFSNLNSTVNLFVLFSGMGLSATLTRYVVVSHEEPLEMGKYIGTLKRICEVMSLFFAVILFVGAKQVSYLSSGGYELTSYFRIVGIVVYFASVAAVEQSIMIGMESFMQSSLVQVVRCFIFFIVSYFFSKLWGITGSICALLLAHGVQYVISLVLNHKAYRQHGIVCSYAWDAETKKAVTTFAIPAFVSSLFVLPVSWVGNAIVTRMFGFAELAIFNVANQWMTYVTYIPSQMGQMRPIYTDLYEQRKLNKLKKMVFKVTLTTSILATGIAAVFILLSNFILSMYGENYLVGKLAFILMLISAVEYTMQVQTGFFLQAAGKMWMAFAVNCVWGILMIVTLLISVNYTGGAVSYAISYCLSYAVIFVIQAIILLRMQQTRTEPVSKEV